MSRSRISSVIITSPARIKDVLTSLQSSRRIALLMHEGQPVGHSPLIVGRGHFKLASSVPADRLRVRGWNAIYEFDLVPAGDGAYRFPRALDPVIRRRDRRLVGPDFIERVTLNGRALTVLDASWTGLRVEPCDDAVDGPLVLTLDPDWGDELTAQARVTHRCTTGVGLDLTPTGGDWEGYAEALSAALHPNTTHTAPSAVAVWAALQDWFFHIRGPGAQGFAEIQDAWEDAHQAVLDGETQGHVVLHQGGWGTLAFLNLYSRSWVGHQLGVLKRIHELEDRGQSEQVKRDLYMHCTELMQGRMAQRGAGDWWMIATCRTAPWLSRHWDYGRRHPVGVNVSVQPVDVNCMDPLNASVTAPDVEVLPVLDLRDVHARLSALRPDTFLQAFDLDPEHYDLAAARELLAPLGLELHRRTFVARDERGPMLYGIVEIATRGLNAFRLFDSLRFVPARDLSNADLERAWKALTIRAHAFFRGDRDVLIEDTPRDYFVVNFEERGRIGLPAYLEEFTADPLGHGFVWVVPGEVLPRFLERIWESTPHATGASPKPAQEFPDVRHRPDLRHPLAPDAAHPPARPG